MTLMAKFTLTLEDSEDGQIEIRAIFDPPITRGQGEEDLTPAQAAATRIVNSVVRSLPEKDQMPKEMNGQEISNAG